MYTNANFENVQIPLSSHKNNLLKVLIFVTKSDNKTYLN